MKLDEKLIAISFQSYGSRGTALRLKDGPELNRPPSNSSRQRTPAKLHGNHPDVSPVS